MACGVSRLSLVTTIRLGDDADNVRAEGEKQVIVGYAKGGLAVLDAYRRFTADASTAS